MISDPELSQWSELWRSGNMAQEDIAARAHKAVRRFRLWIYLEVLVTIVMGGGFTIWAWQARQPAITYLTIWVWVSLAIAWIFRLINDRNDFTGAAVATGSYLATLLRRHRSSLRAAVFGGVLYVVQIVVTYTWLYRELSRQGRASELLPTNIVLVLGTLVFAAWLLRYRRKLHWEIAELEKLQSELGDSSPAQSRAWWEQVTSHLVGQLLTVRKKWMRI